MPMLSPWAEKVSKKELQVYLGIWLFTTIIPLVRQLAGGNAPAIYGPLGIPNLAKYPLWGESSWNTYGLFYYLSGFVGYMLLGLYFRRFVGELGLKKTLAIAVPAFLCGFAMCSCGFLSRVWADSDGVFPIEGPVAMAANWEIPWLNDTLGVALMTIAFLLLFRMIKSGGVLYSKVLLPVSKVSYGMYLNHMLLLSLVSAWLRSAFGIGPDGMFGIWTTPIEAIGTAVISFAGTAIFCVILQQIPRVGKWIV